MAQPYFIFKGIDSRDMGVVVETLPTIQRPRRKITRYDVTGRDGALEVDEGGYDGYTTTMKINAFGQKLETLNAWLDGDGWFITSDEPDRQLWVVMDAQLKGTRYNVSGAQSVINRGSYSFPTAQLATSAGGMNYSALGEALSAAVQDAPVSLIIKDKVIAQTTSDATARNQTIRAQRINRGKGRW